MLSEREQLCKTYTSTDKNLRLLGEKITNSELVIFPTETVYGIGGNLFSKTAIENIYKIKNRPTTNPLIVHCLGQYDASTLIEINELENKIFSSLINTFSPGPITYLLKSSENIPDYIRNVSDYVAIRFPKNKILRSLIQYSGVPICAPSANISTRTSSTSLEHVYKYFRNTKINIINDNDYVCEHGIESTIIKIENNILTIMRQGAILLKDIEEFIKTYNTKNDSTIILKDTLNKPICPGQYKLHYSPNKPTYILNIIDFNSSELKFPKNLKDITNKYLSETILIDFNSLGFKYRNLFLGYVDLSKSGDMKEAMFNLYNVFHQTDSLNCTKILVYNFSFVKDSGSIWDKIVKASENKILSIPLELLG
jgi:L-threonylcarbamoyladenylate synthase